jgi:hypothetical protein
MSNRFSKLISLLGLATASALCANQANALEVDRQLIAQSPVTIDVIRPAAPINLNELMNEAFWYNGGDLFEQASIDGQLNYIFGWRTFPEGSFSENNIRRDSLLMNTITRDFFKQVVEREPTIRTRDIPNPFNSSVQQNPSYINE